MKESAERPSKHQHRGTFSNLVKKLWGKKGANKKLWGEKGANLHLQTSMTLKKEKKRRVRGLRYSSFSFKMIKKKRYFCTYERKTNLVQEAGM